MTQVNKYTDRAAYAADTERLTSQSAISYIESDAVTLYDGVNIVVDKPAAAVGDLAVYDKTNSAIRFIKSATIAKAQLPAALIPLAVVYARQGERLLVVSLDNATSNGSASVRWAASYEVALSGFDLTAGGEFTLRIASLDYPIAYPAGTTLSQIALQINALPNMEGAVFGGWNAKVDDSLAAIVMACNNYAASYATIDVVSGCTIRRTPENVNYQTTQTGLLIDGTVEYVRRNNRVNALWAGCNSEKFLQHYAINGSEKTGQKPGSAEIIRESVFTMQANPELVAAYPSYRDYLLSEHTMQYPAAYGAVLRDGKTNTGVIGRLRFTDIRGNSVACYPAAAAALDYGVASEGSTTGLEAGAWWLPSVGEIYALMHDRVLTAADRERDPVNRTLTRMGKATCYGAECNLSSSCECNNITVFTYKAPMGDITTISKPSLGIVRPVCAL